MHICLLVWASSISISKCVVFECLTTGIDFRGPAESTKCDKQWKFLNSFFSVDPVAPRENIPLFRSEARDLCLLNIVWTTRRICHVNRRRLWACSPHTSLNTAGETRKGQVPWHSKSSVLFSRLQNNDWSISIYNTLL